ncbi:MAG: preprotein translocase subunit SecA [Gammaproteobacteria bacterium]|nr:preprotein translocase subunit SecA [Gammaproteobacteria bacterium]MYF31303.1 preprotein translocase subunit SecA [Gammaproteobacteria bacterium]MYK47788.1 preprotein translocase subunit SecA [Gammaproteobacteria bacterium]
MIANVVRKVFGSSNARELKRMGRVVQRINALEPAMQALSDTELADKTPAFRERLAAGESLGDILPEAFAAVREASRRFRGERPYDVQLIGGITLHEGNIAEMRTGEGKTLVATLPAYLNALGGAAVHIVTVNDYLARRDAAWMGPIYDALGMTVGVLQNNQDRDSKQAAYRADVTYGTNSEFGFDYLRDNMVFTKEDRSQRTLDFAIVDEVDSILIDEARTPLIISGPAEASTDLYMKIDKLAPKLQRQEKIERGLPAVLAGNEPEPEETGDFFVDEKNRQVELTERGHEFVEKELKRLGLLDEHDTLYAAANLGLLHHVHAALKAHFLFQRDVHYMVQDGEVVIVDEHTGRALPGRTWRDGIHQAIEAKERLQIRRENQTVASTTLQNYFRLYGKLAGMTGTADTEATEFKQIYGLEVVIIPTHMPMVRDDRNDQIYLTIDEKYDAIVEEIEEVTERGQPVLVGTASIESSERLSKELNQRKIRHSVLNAKQHEREAEIVAQAGRPRVVTIATNMAGRGTDIVLGGNWEAEVAALGEDRTDEQVEPIKTAWQERHQAVIDAGGLHIVGTERHESRRIDNQLRGRAGRQGDPGSSRFFLSMEDDLMRIFASDRLRGFMQSLGLEHGEAIEHRMVNNSIEKAQRRVEGRNFDARKELLEYDDVANDQRHYIYEQRNELMDGDDIADAITEIREGVIDDLVSEYIPPESIEDQWDVDGLEQALATEFNSVQTIRKWLDEDDALTEEGVRDRIVASVDEEYKAKEEEWKRAGIHDMRMIERQLMLQVLDQKWKEHLATMDDLRQGIHLRAYAQKRPKQEYKRESFLLFQDLQASINRDVIRLLSRVQIRNDSEIEEAERQRRLQASRTMSYSHADSAGSSGDGLRDNGASPQRRRAQGQPARVETFVRSERKIGRNELCPCGSGKKYKRCCGQAA